MTVADKLVRCGRPATTVVDLGDNNPYWMCDADADHSIKNRGGLELVPAKGWRTE